MPNSNSQSLYQIVSIKDGHLEFQINGDWVMDSELPSIDSVKETLSQHSGVKCVVFNTSKLGQWDSRLISFILRLSQNIEAQAIKSDYTELSLGIQGLLKLATAVPERKGARKKIQRQSILEQLGNRAINIAESVKNSLAFIGEVWLSLFRFVQGKARFRNQDFWAIAQECGPSGLPIVALIALLIGLILAYIGAIQLHLFGADIYVANLVAIGMTREMGAMMTAIIMAGRTGAAFAAQIGTMQVNEEIDAFKTMGIAAMDFLVLPRILALIIMMPLLTVFADIVGILGGALVGIGMLDLSLLEYYQQTKGSITVVDFSTGIIKSVAFGIIIACTGCMSGIYCGRSSSAVGDAATKAVVTSIVSIVVIDAVFTIIFERLGI